MFLAFFILFFANFISADNASSTTYSVGSYNLGSAGGNGSSASYSETSTTTFQQGVGNISGSSFTGKSFWFPLIPTPSQEAVPSTPAATTASSSGGGGGAATIYNQISDLTFVPDSFSLPETAGIKDSQKIYITSSALSQVDVSASVVGLEDIIKLSEDIFSIPGGETKILELEILANESGILTGKIRFSSGGKISEVPVILNVNSELSLFDVSLDISDASKTINIGENLKAQITLLQAGLQEKRDVKINYLVKDYDGKTYLESSETLAVFKEKTYLHDFNTRDLIEGTYVAGIEVVYSGGIATAGHQFKVASPNIKSLNLLAIILLLVAISILAVLIVIVKIYKKGAQ